jgi:hypothetical protein
MKKLGEYDHSNIDTFGCAMLVNLKIGADSEGGDLTKDQVITAYGAASWNNLIRPFDCWIGGIHEHEELVRLGVVLAGGSAQKEIDYLFREDEGRYVFGSEDDIQKCNYFVGACAYPNDPDGKHFFQCNLGRVGTWNPGNTYGEVISFRGFRIK